MRRPSPPHQPFNRPPRIRPQLPAETIRLPAPPSSRERQGRSWMALLPALLTTGTMLLAYSLTSRSSGRSLIFLIPMAAVAVVTALFSAVQIVRERRQQARESAAREQSYRAALDDATRRLIDLGVQQQQIRRGIDPEPAALLKIAGIGPALAPGTPLPRLWERRPSDPDFLALRIGLGEQPTSVTIQPPASADDAPELLALLERFRTVGEVPVTLALPEHGSLGVAGPEPQRRRLVHAMLWQLVTHHAPADVRLAAICEPPADWAWLRWVPHTLPFNGDTHRRMIAGTPAQAEELLIALLDELSRRRERAGGSADKTPMLPQLVLLIDGFAALHHQTTVDQIMRHGAEYGMSALIVVERWEQVPGECGAMVDVAADGSGRYARASAQWTALPQIDQADPRQSEELGRALAGTVLAEGGGSQEIPRNVRLLDLLGIGDASELLPPPRWSAPPANAWHPDLPIGQGAGGAPIFLDLREHHHGPHGIIAGATGAGKSELLQSIIASIAITHAPDRAQLLLIDFKGGASLRIFQHLPHTVGLVTDLQGRMAERAITAIKSEIRWRKELLNSVEAKDIAAYRALAAPPLPLANLLIVIDEFDEMVKEQPDFVKELIRVVKQGRSLGVHLLLATQQPGRAVKDEIKTQLQYWIALRLGSSEDSREMLQRPDAFFLPTNIPGRAYMRVGTGLQLFQAPRVSGPYRPRSDQPDRPALFTIDAVGQVKPLEGPRAPEQPAESEPRRSDLELIVAQLEAAGEPYRAAHRPIWQPPLPTRLTLERVLPPEVVTAVHAERWWSVAPDERWPRLPIGLLDIPQESRQEPIAADLPGGHLVIIGSPGSGKTVLLRALLMALALTYTPADAWCYAVDAGGQGLSAFRSMPHMGGLVQVREVDRVRRMIKLVQRELARRQELFRQENVADLPAYRRETGQRLPALLLIIDKFALFREEHEAIVDELIALARVSRAYGIHLIITADRPNDVPFRLLGLFESRLVLRLNDEGDSIALTSKRIAAQLPAEAPGRGVQLVPEHGWLEFQVVLPYLESGTVELSESEEAASSLLDAEINSNTRLLMERLEAAWQAMPEAARLSPRPVRLLPDLVPFAQAWAQTASANGTDGAGLHALVGLEDQTMTPAQFHLRPALPAVLVVGGPRSGKTTALRAMVLSLARRYGPAELGLVLVDPRGTSFRELRTLPHVALAAATEPELAALAAQLNTILETSDGSRRWLVCVDDYDLGRSLMAAQFAKPFGSSPNKTFAVVLEALASLGRDRSFTLAIGANIGVAPTGLLAQLNAGRSGLLLRTHDFPIGTNLLGVKLPIAAPGGAPPVGRALMVVEGETQLVQVALPSDHDITHTIEEATRHGGESRADAALHSSLA